MPQLAHVDTNKAYYDNLYPISNRSSPVKRKQQTNSNYKKYPRIATPDSDDDDENYSKKARTNNAIITYKPFFNESINSIEGQKQIATETELDENHNPYDHFSNDNVNREPYAKYQSPHNQKYRTQPSLNCDEDYDYESQCSTDKTSDIMFKPPFHSGNHQIDNNYSPKYPPIDLSRLGPPHHKLKFGPFYEDSYKDREIEEPTEPDATQQVENTSTVKRKSWLRRKGNNQLQRQISATSIANNKKTDDHDEDGTIGKLKRKRSIRKSNKNKSRSAYGRSNIMDRDFYLAPPCINDSSTDHCVPTTISQRYYNYDYDRMERSVPQRQRKRDVFVKLFKHSSARTS